MKIIGLRIDVDTFRGTRSGVPALCRTLDSFEVLGTFYFSVGPDNMGRHLWRLLKPAFLWKMLRSNAAGLYGPEIILMGTAWPGPLIGKNLWYCIHGAGLCGHEIGFHAWDHHRSQAKLERFTPEEVEQEFRFGVSELEKIAGCRVRTTAAPGWRMTEKLLAEKEKYGFDYNSDCRGTHPFYPVVDGRRLALQIPVTLPTYDEVIGQNGVSDENYNEYQISLLREDRVNVLTIHAEAEGGRCNAMFEDYLRRVRCMGYRVVPLGEIAAMCRENAPEGKVELSAFPGREGKLAVQQPPVPEEQAGEKETN